MALRHEMIGAVLGKDGGGGLGSNLVGFFHGFVKRVSSEQLYSHKKSTMLFCTVREC